MWNIDACRRQGKMWKGHFTITPMVLVPRLRAAGPLLLWQLCSLLLTTTGYLSQRLAQIGLNAPTAQSALAYMLLSLHGLLLLRRRWHGRAVAPEAGNSHRVRWYHWLAIAVADGARLLLDRSSAHCCAADIP